MADVAVFFGTLDAVIPGWQRFYKNPICWGRRPTSVQVIVVSMDLQALRLGKFCG